MSTDSAEETLSQAIPQMEINISNTNSTAQIVLNDLLLMELLCRYPFLFGGHEDAQKDEDYDSWGWDQLATAFNESYEGIQLSAPFSVSELQWRWDKLRPLVGALAKAKGQIPDPLWRVVGDVHRCMQSEKQPEVPKTKCQDLLLSQLPFLNSLSNLQRRRLEVEVLDLILEQERLEKATHKLGAKEQEAALSEYDEFLKAIRVKELPADTLLRLAMDGFCISREPQSKILNGKKSDLMISNVFSAQDASNGVKREPNETAAAKTPQKPRYVPLKSAKYYIRNLRIRVRRIDFDDHLPLATIRRSSRSTLNI
ncbi:uncharacterized protein LOC108039639 [Drosophila rhopaloa]|uniref:Uncharacterized protein LOC108039639 n=1 Tax=Drosophila rhopaloa TaxID=1041015 RepID=A0A6P4E6N5_DRORH|nr:uncharacterized protein LOC108039639 [Drosophila rhopaloa]